MSFQEKGRRVQVAPTSLAPANADVLKASWFEPIEIPNSVRYGFAGEHPVVEITMAASAAAAIHFTGISVSPVGACCAGHNRWFGHFA